MGAGMALLAPFIFAIILIAIFSAKTNKEKRTLGDLC